MKAIPALAFAAAISVHASAQSVPQLKLVEDLRIDGAANDFTGFLGVAVNKHGEMAMMFPDDANVRIFSSTGKPIATVGRPGQGPGEFSKGIGIVPVWIEDTLWVNDLVTHRESFISRTGRILRSVSYDHIDADGGRLAPGKRVSYTPHTRSADGTTLGAGAFSIGTSDRGPGPPPMRFGVARAANNSAVLLALLPLSDQYEPVFVGTGGQTYSPDGTRFAFLQINDLKTAGGSVTLFAFRANGDTILNVRIPYAGVPMPRHVADSMLAGRRITDVDGRRIAAPPADAGRIPPVYNPVGGKPVFGSDDRIWVSLMDAVGSYSAHAVDARGKVVGRFKIPARSRVVAANATHVWMIERDSDDLQSIVRYRLTN